MVEESCVGGFFNSALSLLVYTEIVLHVIT